MLFELTRLGDASAIRIREKKEQVRKKERSVAETEPLSSSDCAAATLLNCLIIPLVLIISLMKFFHVALMLHKKYNRKNGRR